MGDILSTFKMYLKVSGFDPDSAMTAFEVINNIDDAYSGSYTSEQIEEAINYAKLEYQYIDANHDYWCSLYQLNSNFDKASALCVDFSAQEMGAVLNYTETINNYLKETFPREDVPDEATPPNPEPEKEHKGVRSTH